VPVPDVIAMLNEEREKIWLEAPAEVVAIGRGEIPRRTGSHGQYLSTLIFAEGEARTLADEMLWGLWRVAQEGKADLATLQAIVAEIIGYKASFFDFNGLPHAAGVIKAYVDAVQTCTDLDEFAELTGAALSYANRIHMWIDFVFPWGVTNGFPRPERRAAALRSAADQAS
jgi:Cucumopine synthase C-terminal helical bundle domain